MKKLKLLVMLLFAFIATFAQTNNTDNAPASNWLSQNWETLIPVAFGVYEVVVRYFPTASNWSVLTIIMKILRALVPNKSKEGNTHD